MSTILVRDPLTPVELSGLQQEFPQFTYQLSPALSTLGAQEWSDVEIIYGSKLAASELEEAHRLRWIHVPRTSLDELCWQQIGKTTNILISQTKSPIASQAGEFALSIMLAFAKGLFHWQVAQDDPKEAWDHPTRSQIWTLKDRTFLQIGLRAIGTATTRCAQDAAMRVWGVQDPPSFHPNCDKVFSSQELHSLLPAADVVCISAPRGQRASISLGHAQFELMKRDSILIVIGRGLINETELLQVAATGKFRGVAVDGEFEEKGDRPPNFLITPCIAELPEIAPRLAFNIFLHNLRRYIHNDFDGMKNLVQPTAST